MTTASVSELAIVCMVSFGWVVLAESGYSTVCNHLLPKGGQCFQRGIVEQIKRGPYSGVPYYLVDSNKQNVTFLSQLHNYIIFLYQFKSHNSSQVERLSLDLHTVDVKITPVTAILHHHENDGCQVNGL